MLYSQNRFLTDLFDAAVAAADPETALSNCLPAKPKGRTVVIGAGKGVAQLAAAFERLWQGPLCGVVVTRYGYAVPCQNLTVLEAAHPVPDQNGLAATAALFEAVKGLMADDLVVALICGGGSSLLPAPMAGLTLGDEIALNKTLLASGAPISVMNLIRKQISRIKGGQLAQAAAPAKVISLIVSDVPGDDPAQVASGPTVTDFRGAAEALSAIRAYSITLPENLQRFIEALLQSTPPVVTPDGNEVHIIASASKSLEAAAQLAEVKGVRAVVLSDAIEGEAREIAKMHAAMACQIVDQNRPFMAPVVMLSGGETTVTLGGSGGRGGRNTEFLLSFAHEIEGRDTIFALAADTDGIDGSEQNAGAFCSGQTSKAMRQAGIDPSDALLRHDSWTAFHAIDALFAPGPTGTNVNDFRAIYIMSPAQG
ncbi:MAG: glycerate kinase [Paracoccaceae bacterium]|nr:glycerate kinase [Paracoccaceae bacterium]